MVRKQHEMEWLANRGEHVEREGVETIFDVVKRVSRANDTPDAHWQPQVQSRPTQTPVGSLERVEEYARRVERGEELWNEKDPTCFASRFWD